MNNKAWALALTVGLLGSGSAAQAALVPLTLGGVDVVCDDDYTPVGASSPGLIWTADANLATSATFGVTGINANGTMTWDKAQEWIAAMNTANYGGANDWRLWSALNNDGSGSGTAGKVVIIHRTAQSAASFDDRIYGSLTTQSDGQYINFNGETDYEKSATVDLPSADPAQKEFGFGREFASLVNNETHTTRDEDAIFTWDADAQVWQNTGTGSITAGVALEKVGSTLNVLVDGSTITTNGSNELTLVAGVAFADHKFAADIGDGVTNPINVNHALGSTDVIVQVYENSSGDQIDIDIEVIDANNIEIETNPGQIPGSNELRVVVLG